MAHSIAIIVLSHPISQQSSLSAYRFTEAALASGHQIYQVFFYADGASHGNALSLVPQDETDVNKLWQSLAQQHHVPLVICSGSALRRGVLDETEAVRKQLLNEPLLAGFSLKGLGELAKAYRHSDRVVVFGT